MTDRPTPYTAHDLDPADAREAVGLLRAGLLIASLRSDGGFKGEDATRIQRTIEALEAFGTGHVSIEPKGQP